MQKPYPAWHLPLLFLVLAFQVVMLAIRRWALNPPLVGTGAAVILGGLLAWYLALRRADNDAVGRNTRVLLVAMVLFSLFGSRALKAML